MHGLKMYQLRLEKRHEKAGEGEGLFTRVRFLNVLVDGEFKMLSLTGDSTL